MFSGLIFLCTVNTASVCMIIGLNEGPFETKRECQVAAARRFSHPDFITDMRKLHNHLTGVDHEITAETKCLEVGTFTL